MNIVPPEERFQKNAKIMAEAVLEAIQTLYKLGYQTIDPNMVILVVTVISSLDKHYLIRGFIENSHEKCWDEIKKRDEVFFVKNACDIFKYLPMDKVNLFKDLFQTKDSHGQSVIDQDLKNQIWALFDAMIKISINYVHIGRGAYSCATTKGIKNSYKNKFFDNIDITTHANIWKVNLEFPLEC